MTLKELLDIWLNDYCKKSIKVHTYDKYYYLVYKHIVPKLGDNNIKNINTLILQKFLNEEFDHGNLATNGKLSTNTVYGIYSILKQVFNFALSLNLLKNNACNMIKLPTITEKPISAFSLQEQKKIEEFCLKGKLNYLGIVICLYTGLRLGELLALTWDDIDFNSKTLLVSKTIYLSHNQIIIDTPKTRTSTRQIPIAENILSILKKIKEESTSNYIISSNKNTYVLPRTYQRAYKNILKKCGIKYKNFHCLRHTFATRSLEIGMDVKTLAEIMGHNNPSITLNRYSHSLIEHKRKMINKLTEI